jgi:hypothetical protein
MSDSSFKTVKVIDATIGDITSDLVFAVQSGASSTTYQSFPCNSPSNSSVTFAVQIPSESIVSGRDVLLRAGITFTVNVGSVTDATKQVQIGDCAFSYGIDSALAPFPLSSLMTTVNCQINNTSVSSNLQDILPQILQMNDRAHLAYYNGMCPSLPDGDYGIFSQAVGANNNPMGSYVNDGYSNKLQGRGAFPVVLDVYRYALGVFADKSLISLAVTDTWKIVVSTVVTEPLFLSPFTWGNPERNAQGMVGINNMAFTFNLDASLKRVFSSATPYVTSVVAGSLVNTLLFGAETPTLLFKFLSTQPSDLIASKNVLPFTDYPRYLTTANAPILSLATSAPIYTQSLQLNQMPSKIVLIARKPIGSQSCNDPSTFLTIKSVSINLNNASGLLSSASAQDLWRMSARNGSNQTWAQFSGVATGISANYVAPSNGILTVATGGSMLVLDPALDLSLPDYITNGSLGNYNLQVQVVLLNQYGETITPEIVIMCVNDGIMTTVQGVSSTFTGIITKQMCLDAKAMKGIPSVEESRMVGGKMANMSAIRHPRFGMSVGGVMSAGAVSGGGRSKLAGLY